MMLPTPRATGGTKGGPSMRGSGGDLMLPSLVTRLPKHRRRSDLAGTWGRYADAVARWENIIGLSVPAPLEPVRGKVRLSTRLVEWMMGLPPGYVTDVPGLSRDSQFRVLGNGVVPRQGAEALRLLLP